MWSADLNEVEADLQKLDEEPAAELRAAIQEFFREYYPPGLGERALRLEQGKIRRRWGVDEAEAARPERVWEFRPEQGSHFRVLFGEDPTAFKVLFLGIVIKARGPRRQTRAMSTAAKRLRRRLGR